MAMQEGPDPPTRMALDCLLQKVLDHSFQAQDFLRADQATLPCPQWL